MEFRLQYKLFPNVFVTLTTATNTEVPNPVVSEAIAINDPTIIPMSRKENTVRLSAQRDLKEEKLYH